MTPSFIKLMRIYQGITQEELVQGIGIKKASLSAYEHGKFKLASNYVYALCEKLGIDPDYAEERTKYPFKKENRFYKMFLSHEGAFMGVPLFEPLYSLLEFSKSADVLILTGEDILPGIKHRHNWLREVTIAVAVRDMAGNVFILRERDNRHLVLFPSHLKEIIADQIEISKDKGKTVSTAVFEAGIRLRGKIEKWTVNKEDLDVLFDNADFVPVIKVTKEEASYLLLRRAVNIASSDSDE